MLGSSGDAGSAVRHSASASKPAGSVATPSRVLPAPRPSLDVPVCPHRQRLDAEEASGQGAGDPATPAAAGAGAGAGTGPDAHNWQILHRTGPHVWTDSVLQWVANASVGWHEALAPGVWRAIQTEGTGVATGLYFGYAGHARVAVCQASLWICLARLMHITHMLSLTVWQVHTGNHSKSLRVLN